MKKFEVEIDGHDRAFGAGEEVRFILEKTRELLDAGKVNIDSYGDDQRVSELVSRTDNYVVRVSRTKDDHEKRGSGE